MGILLLLKQNILTIKANALNQSSTYVYHAKTRWLHINK